MIKTCDFWSRTLHKSNTQKNKQQSTIKTANPEKATANKQSTLKLPVINLLFKLLLLLLLFRLLLVDKVVSSRSLIFALLLLLLLAVVVVLDEAMKSSEDLEARSNEKSSSPTGLVFNKSEFSNSFNPKMSLASSLVLLLL